jgi:hypothetical protein
MGYCTACGAARGPLAAKSVSLAGQPSKIGGTVARVFGWIVLSVGWGVALLLFGLMFALFGTAPVTWILSAPIALIATSIWLLSFLGGKSLTKSGAKEERSTQEQAVFALAQTRRGRLRAMDVSASLGMPLMDADGLLTDMAKKLPDHMAVDVDDQGELIYRFPRIDLEYRTRVVEAEVMAGAGAQRSRVEEPQKKARVEAADFAEYVDEEVAREAAKRP